MQQGSPHSVLRRPLGVFKVGQRSLECNGSFHNNTDCLFPITLCWHWRWWCEGNSWSNCCCPGWRDPNTLLCVWDVLPPHTGREMSRFSSVSMFDLRPWAQVLLTLCVLTWEGGTKPSAALGVLWPAPGKTPAWLCELPNYQGTETADIPTTGM